MRILQFTAMQEPEATARLIRLTGRTPATVVLDLEDGLWDVTDEPHTAALRTAGRAGLVTLARTHPELFAGRPIGVRINRISGPDAALDFEALGRLSRFAELDCVVPTKVESAAHIRENLAGLRHHHVACRAVIPIVETRAGMANLDDITETARGSGIEWLVYGHFDFSLDSGLWPFPEPCDPPYWERAESLIRRWEAAGLGYIHPPYFRTRDRAGMAGILARLARTCTREFGIISVGPRQTDMIDRLGRRAGEAPRALDALDRTDEASDRTDEAPDRTADPARRAPEAADPAALARHVVETFLATRHRTLGFALDPASGEFISPHVYVAARDYLRRVSDA